MIWLPDNGMDFRGALFICCLFCGGGIGLSCHWRWNVMTLNHDIAVLLTLCCRQESVYAGWHAPLSLGLRSQLVTNAKSSAIPLNTSNSQSQHLEPSQDIRKSFVKEWDSGYYSQNHPQSQKKVNKFILCNRESQYRHTCSSLYSSLGDRDAFSNEPVSVKLKDA